MLADFKEPADTNLLIQVVELENGDKGVRVNLAKNYLNLGRVYSLEATVTFEVWQTIVEAITNG